MAQSLHGDASQDDMIDRLLATGDDQAMPVWQHAQQPSGRTWLDALLAPPSMSQGAYGGYGRHGSAQYGRSYGGDPALGRGMGAGMSRGGTRGLQRGGGSSTARLHRSSASPNPMPSSSVTGLLELDGLRAAGPGPLRRHGGGRDAVASQGSGVSFDELVRDAGGDAVVEAPNDAFDTDYDVPIASVRATPAHAPSSATPAGARVVKAKVRPTKVLGGYDMLGGIWDGVMQGLVIICVSILPLAIMTLMAQDVLGKWCTSPLCIVFPISAVALSVLGARFTKVLHCDLWDRLTTPDALPAARNGG